MTIIMTIIMTIDDYYKKQDHDKHITATVTIPLGAPNAGPKFLYPGFAGGFAKKIAGGFSGDGHPPERVEMESDQGQSEVESDLNVLQHAVQFQGRGSHLRREYQTSTIRLRKKFQKGFK
jgi:hypothetical protein